MVKRSSVWKHFSDGPKQIAICHHCRKPIRTCGNTSNLKDHLRAKHNINVDAVAGTSKISEKDSTRSNKTTTPDTNLPGSSSSAEGSTSAPATSSSTSSQLHNSDSLQKEGLSYQEDISRSFKKIHACKEGGKRYEQITDDIIYMICKDYEPFSMVEREGFKTFVKKNLPQYRIPTRKTIKTQMEKKYKKVSSNYKDFLKNSNHITLTTDIWTDTMNTRSFLGVTTHFQQNSEMFSANLGVHQMSTNHTGLHIRDKLAEVCTEWEIPLSKITAIVTDNGANIVLAVELYLGKKCHLACFAHTINLIATNSVKSVKGLPDLIKKVKHIVTFFRESVNAADELRAHTELKLIQDILTRWNSTFYMIERFLLLRQFLSTVLINHPKGPAMVTASEIETLIEIMAILKPLESVTREISGEKYVTASKVIPMIRLMTRLYERISTSHELAIYLKEAILKEFKQRWSKVEFNHLLAMANLLDPRFKKVHFQDKIACSRTIRFVSDAVRELTSQQKESRREFSETPASGKLILMIFTFRVPISNYYDAFITLKIYLISDTDVDSSIWADHNQIVKDINQKLQEEDDAELPNEVQSYLHSPLALLEADPIKMWTEMAPTYPNLSKIALKYLSIVVTSVPSERLFSKAGHMLNEKRNRLGGRLLSQQLFLQSVGKEHW